MRPDALLRSSGRTNPGEGAYGWPAGSVGNGPQRLILPGRFQDDITIPEQAAPEGALEATEREQRRPLRAFRRLVDGA